VYVTHRYMSIFNRYIVWRFAQRVVPPDRLSKFIRCLSINTPPLHKAQTCKSSDLYPASRQDGGVECRQCHCAGRAWMQKLVDLLKGRGYNSQSRAWEPLHCQISACLRREDKGWTGVGEADRLCARECPSLPPSLSLCLSLLVPHSS
jgi:hypothetical protein